MDQGRDSLLQLLSDADRGGYAIPAFNYSDVWDLKAIVRAANIEGAPIMVSANPWVFKEIGPELCGKIFEGILSEAKTPVFHHLDHADREENCYRAIQCGFPSVMMDASMETLEDNIRKVGAVVKVAHATNVLVEAEVGKIKGRGVEGGSETDWLARPEDARLLWEKTDVDTLAVGIGTAHGFYEGKPELNFKRLSEINEAIDIPLVLHGGTGIPAGDIRKAIKNGINKINVGTGIHTTYMNGMLDELTRLGRNQYTIDVVRPVIGLCTEFVRDAIRMCMADNKALKYK